MNVEKNQNNQQFEVEGVVNAFLLHYLSVEKNYE
jgi:hypothetical protein